MATKKTAVSKTEKRYVATDPDDGFIWGTERAHTNINELLDEIDGDVDDVASFAVYELGPKVGVFYKKKWVKG